MIKSMRQSTLQTLGLGTVLEIFQNGKPPVDATGLVDRVFGSPDKRGSLVISGANGIVGAGKTMQLGARLQPFGVPLVALDMAGAPAGLSQQYSGLLGAFGRKQAGKIMENIVQLTYDGATLPSQLDDFRPRFLLEAIPEILDLKKEHYRIFRSRFPEIDIYSVTSGFPSSQLGTKIAHPAFPHQINKVWEIVEESPSPSTQLLWALGLIPIPVGDNWSFVLDVLFCGLTLAGIEYHATSNMPFWKIDKYIRKILGPNPFRAHDAIGAKGANFLTWSCLHHLAKQYGALFSPHLELNRRKDSGENWYPLNHFRPLVNWTLDDGEMDEFRAWILGPMCQMTSMMIHEQRAHLSHINIIGELCAQFDRGMPAVIRDLGADNAIKQVDAYHKLCSKASESCWYPEVFEQINSPQWQQLYVNAEHDGKVGVISIGRESYNADVNAEMNRAIDWLKAEGIERIIVSGDFHLSTQLVGADTGEFYPALQDAQKGVEIALTWSKTARRLHDEFEISIGFVNGKRCLGGMLELMSHCHYLVAAEQCMLGMPEITLPVIPGMEGCHWLFRKASPKSWPRLLDLLLTGKSVKAKDALGWLADYAGPLEDALSTAWKLATGEKSEELRKVESAPLKNVFADMPVSDGPFDARKAIVDAIRDSCNVPLAEALSVQAKHSGDFMTSPACRAGKIGQECKKKMTV